MMAMIIVQINYCLRFSYSLPFEMLLFFAASLWLTGLSSFSALLWHSTGVKNKLFVNCSQVHATVNRKSMGTSRKLWIRNKIVSWCWLVQWMNYWWCQIDIFAQFSTNFEKFLSIFFNKKINVHAFSQRGVCVPSFSIHKLIMYEYMYVNRSYRRGSKKPAKVQ